MSIVHSLWVSKLRYGLQLCFKVRLTNSDLTPACLKSLQTNQNRMLRAIIGSKISDRVSTESMLKKFGLLSVSQLCAKIKLIEIWKSLNKEYYPINLDPYRLVTSLSHYHDTRDHAASINQSPAFTWTQPDFGMWHL